MKTRTGNYSLGVRTFLPHWDAPVEEVIQWAKENDLECLDLAPDAESVRKVKSAGLRIGTVDFLDWASKKNMVTANKASRQESLDANTALVESCAAFGKINYFVVMLPEDPTLPPAENYQYMLEFLHAIMPVMESCDAAISIEGWPGPGALCCTPESCRKLFFEDIPSKHLGFNYDPSHLIRMGIDPYRFLEEFGEKVVHVHGKDTEFNPERLYEYGDTLRPMNAERFRFGDIVWRYTIPGHGVMNWHRGFTLLENAGYSGCVCIEMEDYNFCVSKEGSQKGALLGCGYLEGC
jgi:sugar phosphate isomerase/epimerase